MKRFESLSSLQTDARRLGYNARLRSRSVGESSVRACVVRAPESNWLRDCKDSDPFVKLEQKIDALNELFVEQCNLYTEIRTHIRNARAAMKNSELARNKHVTELLPKVLSQSQVTEIEDSDHGFNRRASSLLNAIETQHGLSLDREIGEALAEFLQSDELRQHMISAAEQALLSVMDCRFTRDVSAMFISILRNSQKGMSKNLVKVLQSGFIELEHTLSSSASFTEYNACQMLRRTLDQHRELLERPNVVQLGELQQDIEELLGKELKKWREQAIKYLNTLTTVEASDDGPPLDHAPCSSQSMTAAEITKQIDDGDINNAFSRALSAQDLLLVTAACRAAADPSRLRALSQPVLMSLTQQLSTDLVTDTQLKCRYLEEALLVLDPLHPRTREHLQSLITEVLTHLGRFLRKYPKHAARQRVELIIVTALNMKNLAKTNL